MHAVADIAPERAGPPSPPHRVAGPPPSSDPGRRRAMRRASLTAVVIGEVVNDRSVCDRSKSIVGVADLVQPVFATISAVVKRSSASS
jgi:hypothetical protein